MQQPAWRDDALAKVTGRARYTDDLKMSGMLHCVPVYTEHIHAKIDDIDTAKTTRLAGVVKVLTASDIPGSSTFGQIFPDYALLSKGTIRSWGDVVALVVATSRKQAIAAAKLVKVQATPLPVVLDPKQAMQPGSALVHPAKGTNLINHHKIRRGNVDAAFSECDNIVTRVFTTSPVEHAYLEPESALCYLRDDGVMEVRGSMQHPFSTRRFTAALLGVPLADVEVISVPMGGGFGGKDDTAAIVCARAALAAKICGKPVKMTYTREWSMRESYKRHPYRLEYKIGLKGQRLHAVHTTMYADGGAYTSVTPWVTWRSTVQCCGTYNVPNVHADVYGVHTNNVFTGAFRGFGSPQVNFAIEQLIEECATACQCDPIEFRRLNMLKQNDCTITEQKLNTHVVSTGQVLETILKASNYKQLLKKCTYGQADELYGVGLALSYRGCSLGAEGMDFCSAIINAQFDGSVILETGIHENGQGAQSAMVLLLAKHLGINKQRIRYTRPSTSHIPDGGTTVASRGTIMGGGAVVNAVKILKDILAKHLHQQLGCQPNQVKVHDDQVWGPSGKSLSWEQAMKILHSQCVYPYAFGTFAAPKVSWNEENGTGNAYFTWGYHCQAVELTVNKKTGRVNLLNVWAAHDIGKAVNPPYLKGQIYGGIMQGAGMALWEDLAQQDGRFAHTSLNRYRIPRATNVPAMHAFIIENPDDNSPSGAKGVGEPALELITPAIANALYRATGKRYYHYPMNNLFETEDKHKH